MGKKIRKITYIKAKILTKPQLKNSQNLLLIVFAEFVIIPIQA